ncbi:DNA polymerase, partial [Salmonella enterica subsp. enterica serovar Muenster]|nr:DNA polymerase [Salmonella enterica subsp. enterica serovar Muenster]
HPMGLKFPVNFMAKNLSSGQQQQLLLARSLSSNASVFLWDEPKVILEYRGLAKLKSTYTDKLPLMINPKTGRVHTSYHQAVTA